VSSNQLSEAAETLQGFPRDSSDTRDILFGAFGANFAGGGVRQRFFCKDMAGHTVVEATIEADYQLAEITERATVIANIEPAAVDQFVVELRRLEIELSGTAALAII
jgi:hypothetical protein